MGLSPRAAARSDLHVEVMRFTITGGKRSRILVRLTTRTAGRAFDSYAMKRTAIATFGTVISVEKLKTATGAWRQ